MSSGEEAVFDPDQSTSGYVRSTSVGSVTIDTADLRRIEQVGVEIVAALGDIHRALIGVEAAILGADTVTVTTSINDEPFQ